jgi:hypothetical protein
MPKKAEEALKRSARRKGFKPGSKRFNRYVYGGLMNKTKWKPGKGK